MRPFLPMSSPRPGAAVRLAGGRVALASGGSQVALAAAGTDGEPVHVVLETAHAAAWAARVRAVLEAHPPAPDVTPVELRTPWLRGEDGEPALAIERLTRGPRVRWRLLLHAGGREGRVRLGAGEVVELLRCLASPIEAAREVG
jgi:hypothetical protein